MGREIFRTQVSPGRMADGGGGLLGRTFEGVGFLEAESKGFN